MKAFSPDSASIEKAARHHLSEGAVMQSEGADAATICDALNSALATEIVCELRYRAHYHAAEDLGEVATAAEFLEHAEQEGAHSQRLAARIAQLGGTPNFDPSTAVARGHAKYTKPGTIDAMIDANLVYERVAIQVYTELIQWLGDHDPTTRRLVEEILEQEEEHADDLAGLRSKLGKHKQLRAQAQA